MSRKAPERGDLVDKLSKLPRSSRANPFDSLSTKHKKEWREVREAYANGNLCHVSITQLNKSVSEHFGMKPMSFDKFKQLLIRTEDNHA